MASVVSSTRASLLDIRCVIGLQTTDLPLEQEDKEGKKVKPRDDRKRKNTLLPNSCRFEPEDGEKAARMTCQQISYPGPGNPT